MAPSSPRKRVLRWSRGRCAALFLDRALVFGDGGGPDERQSYPFLPDPDHLAFPGRGVFCHHETKLLGYEGWVLDVDRSALGRYVTDHAAHDRARRRHVGRFVDFSALVLSFFFHQL